MGQSKLGRAAGAAGILTGILILMAAAPPRARAGRVFGLDPQKIEWKIKITVERAAVRASADPESPVLARIGQGTVLSSTYAEGAWFRVSVSPEKDGPPITGFISTGDVEIVEEKDWEIDPEDKPFFGLGLYAGVCGGFSMIPDNDLIVGSQGLFEEGQELIRAQGLSVQDSTNPPFPVGYVFDLGLSYELGPRFGLQGGFFMQSARKIDYQTFDDKSQMTSQPDFSTHGVRLGAYFIVPLKGRFRIRLAAEPALLFSTFSYGRHQIDDEEGFKESKLIHLDKIMPALFGSIGLEASVNNRIDLYVAVRGRWARSSGLDAGINLDLTQENVVKVAEDAEGRLYIVPGPGSPRLGVFPAGAAPAGAREAVLDLSGFDILAGLRMKF